MTLHNAGTPFLRPIITADPALQSRGTMLAGSALSFSELAVFDGHGPTTVLPAAAVAALYPGGVGTLARLTRPRTALGSLPMDRPRTLASLVLGSDPTAVLAAGAEALIVTAPETGSAPWAAALQTLGRHVPVILRGLDPEAAVAGAVAAWQAPDWSALSHATLPATCLRVTPRPMAPVDSHAAVRALFDATAAALLADEARGLSRTGVLIDVGTVAPGAFTSLGLLHGLGCALLADLGVATGPHAAAAAAVLVAAQGVQLMTAPDTVALATGLAMWRSVSVPAEPRP